MSYECYMNVTFRFCFRSPLKSLKLPVFKGVFTDLGSHSFLHISFYPLYVGDSWGNREPIEKLIDTGCEIIVCASRTSKDTVNTVYELASNYQYKVVQISALHGEHNDTIENYNLYCCKNAEAIEQLIRNIIRNQLKTIEL